MALTDGFPGASGTVDSVELRRNLAGLITRDFNGNVLAGIFPRHESPLIGGRADMYINVGPFEGISVRGGGPIFMQNDGNILAGPLAAAPASNSRIDVIYFKQNESASPFADANNSPIIGVVTGTPSASPVQPSIAGIPGAVQLGIVTIPAGAATTNAAGVVVTTTAQYTTTAGGVITFRSVANMNTWQAPDGTQAYCLDSDKLYQSQSWVWRPLAPVGTQFAGSTNVNGILTIVHNFGSAPRWAQVTMLNNGIDALSKIVSPIIWDTSFGPTNLQVRFRRSDTNDWAASQPVSGFLTVGW